MDSSELIKLAFAGDLEYLIGVSTESIRRFLIRSLCVSSNSEASIKASFSARKQGYALTMQQGGAALKSLGLGDAVVQQGAVSTLHSSFRWDGQPIGAYGAARRGRRTNELQSTI